MKDTWVWLSVSRMVRDEDGFPVCFAVSTAELTQHDCLNRAADFALTLGSEATLHVCVGGLRWSIEITDEMQRALGRRVHEALATTEAA